MFRKWRVLSTEFIPNMLEGEEEKEILFGKLYV